MGPETQDPGSLWVRVIARQGAAKHFQSRAQIGGEKKASLLLRVTAGAER